ncbi:MAG: hypothetical protein PHE17_18170 [Thiothrix sp.]|uniref:hypothetical protein n=1 Tax=Thiothrix sp. TaxID=1032 RepID=UPI00260DC20B|nr:hypothetical protein [Thiothrix sp.]MDD5394948.1 hypothetical protein [Thiothrix sp.]
MNKTVLHIILMAAGSALLLGLIAFAGPLLPVLSAGHLPTSAQITAALAVALGETLKGLIAVAAIYSGKLKLLGSSAIDPNKIPDAKP